MILQVYEVFNIWFQSKSSWTAPSHKQVIQQIYKIAVLFVGFNSNKLLSAEHLSLYLRVYISFLLLTWFCFRFFQSLSNFVGHVKLNEDILLLFEVCTYF